MTRLAFWTATALLSVGLLGTMSGCASADDSGKASETDKQNIERLAREGVGAPKSMADEEK